MLHYQPERDLLAGLKELLPAHAVPRELTLLDALPRTPTGKVDRNAIRARLIGTEERDDG